MKTTKCIMTTSILLNQLKGIMTDMGRPVTISQWMSWKIHNERQSDEIHTCKPFWRQTQHWHVQRENMPDPGRTNSGRRDLTVWVETGMAGSQRGRQGPDNERLYERGWGLESAYEKPLESLGQRNGWFDLCIEKVILAAKEIMCCGDQNENKGGEWRVGGTWMREAADEMLCSGWTQEML